MICGLMVWELVCMLDSKRSRSSLVLGLVAGSSLALAIEVPVSLALPLLMLPSMVGSAGAWSGAA